MIALIFPAAGGCRMMSGHARAVALNLANLPPEDIAGIRIVDPTSLSDLANLRDRRLHDEAGERLTLSAFDEAYPDAGRLEA